MMRIGILTGGGDCPGLNSVIRSVVRSALRDKDEVIGIRNGWAGLVNDTPPLILDLRSVSGILPRGGTILGTSRTNPLKNAETLKSVTTNFKNLYLDGLIAIGGEDTLGAAAKLSKKGFPIVGVPKTIDNDISGTDYTFGFDTAVNTVMEAIDRLHTTAESHHRILVVEVMGRNAGWIALSSGIAGGADMILIPEFSISIHHVIDKIKKRQERGKTFSIIVVAEGAKFKGAKVKSRNQKRDEFGHNQLGGISQALAAEIGKRTGLETRTTDLGHIQRGGSPSAFDRILGTRFGVKAVDLIKKRKFGYMTALRGTKIVEIPISVAVRRLKRVDKELYQMASKFFG
jgi:ATP-dependent phosphofructokinase / diphosphate-dependent phosphofructokinase